MSKYFYLVPPKKEESLAELIQFLQQKMQAKALMENHELSSTDYVVVCGGDGGLNYALNVLRNDHDRILPTLIYLPCGTANDFSRTVSNFSGEAPLDWFQKCIEGDKQLLPMIKCNDKVFINVASGLNVAEVTTQSSREQKDMVGKLAYYFNGLAKLTDLKTYSAQINRNFFENVKPEQKKLIGFIVSNGLYAGGGIKVSLHNEIKHEDFEILLIGENTGVQLIKLLVKLQTDNPDLSELSVWPFRSKHMKLEFDQEVQVNLDGEPYHASSFEFKEIPAAVSFLLPRTAETT